MSDKDSIANKLLLMRRDKQSVFDKLSEPLQQIAGKGEPGKTVNIAADGNWFSVSFDAVEVKRTVW